MARQQNDVRPGDGETPPSAPRPAASGPGGAGANPTPPTPAMPPRRAWLSFLAILVANILLVRVLFPSADAAVKVPYTLFKKEVTAGNVARIYSRGASVTGRFRAPVTYPAKPDSASRTQPRPVTNFATELPAFVDPGLET